MSAQSTANIDDLIDEPLVQRKPLHENAEFDITAMIDLVFMMNIYFLVTTIAAMAGDIDLPAARNCVAADLDSSVVITILSANKEHPAGILVGKEANTEPLTNPAEQEREVLKAVEEGARKQLSSVLIRAEKNVPLRELMRVSRAISSVEGMQLKVSVLEKE